MVSFSDGFWNIFIIVSTLGGLIGLYLLATLNSSASVAEKSEGEPKTMGHVWDGDLEELNNPLPRWWVIMFYMTLVFAVVYLILYPGLGSNTMTLNWTQTQQYEAEMAAAEKHYGPIFDQYQKTPVEDLAKDTAALAVGERLYASYCTGCHGSDAGGGVGYPNLRDRAWLYGGKPEQVQASILNGRNSIMPPWQAALGDEGVSQMVAYVKSLNASAPGDSNAQAANGKTKYMQLCAACHGANGTGSVALGAPNLTDDVWLYGSDDGALAHSIANGRQGKMPAHKDFLGEAKVHLLATYIWSLSNP
jgi:cytochrome c oxidase cbb3-type subunit III